MLFLVKVRIDISRMNEFGQKLFSGELDRSHTRFSYCLKEDPEVGLNIWEVESQDEYNKILAAYKPYFAEIIEVQEVISPMDSFAILQKKVSG